MRSNRAAENALPALVSSTLTDASLPKPSDFGAVNLHDWSNSTGFLPNTSQSGCYYCCYETVQAARKQSHPVVREVRRVACTPLRTGRPHPPTLPRHAASAVALSPGSRPGAPARPVCLCSPGPGGGARKALGRRAASTCSCSRRLCVPSRGPSSRGEGRLPRAASGRQAAATSRMFCFTLTRGRHLVTTKIHSHALSGSGRGVQGDK